MARTNEYHEGEEIAVDGETWFNCVFVRCKLTRNDPKTQLWGAYYDHCELIGDGWPVEFQDPTLAAETRQALRSIIRLDE